MAFLRTKKINNFVYCYLVENKYHQGGPRQKVKKYLGRVYPLLPIQKKEFISNLTFNRELLLLELIKHELLIHGFKEQGSRLIYQDLIWDKNRVLRKGKDVVLSLNEGYLCSHTVKRILNFTKTNDFSKDGYVLAKFFIEAGIPISREMFINFYEKTPSFKRK